MICKLNNEITIHISEVKCILCPECVSITQYDYGNEIINKVKSIRKYNKFCECRLEYCSDMCIECAYQEFIIHLRDEKLNELLDE